jgi:hypothetical protein
MMEILFCRLVLGNGDTERRAFRHRERRDCSGCLPGSLFNSIGKAAMPAVPPPFRAENRPAHGDKTRTLFACL